MRVKKCAECHSTFETHYAYCPNCNSVEIYTVNERDEKEKTESNSKKKGQEKT